MPLHLFRDATSDVFAFTLDRSGETLPCTQESKWVYLETLETVEFAWGEESFGEVDRALSATGFFLFEGEMQPLPGNRCVSSSDERAGLLRRNIER